jgi:hypothetical protein
MRTTPQALAFQLRQERLALSHVGTVREHAARSARQRRQAEQARETLAQVVAEFRRRRWIA